MFDTALFKIVSIKLIKSYSRTGMRLFPLIGVNKTTSLCPDWIFMYESCGHRTVVSRCREGASCGRGFTQNRTRLIQRTRKALINGLFYI